MIKSVWGHVNTRGTPSGKLHASDLFGDDRTLTFCGRVLFCAPIFPAVEFSLDDPRSCRQCVARLTE